MPNRLLRDGIIESERVNSLSPGAELLYRRLMSKVDDYGRFHGNPALILAACYPLQLDRVSQADVSQWLAECGQMAANVSGSLPLVSIYERDSKKYIQINEFGQRTRSESKFPPPNVREMRANGRDSPSDARDPPTNAAHARGRTNAETETNAETGGDISNSIWRDFWALFVEAGKGLNDRDKETALKLWLNFEPPTQRKIVEWVRFQMAEKWTEEKFTPMPAKVLRDEGWTRIALVKPQKSIYVEDVYPGANA